MSALTDIDAQLLAVHSDYLKAERRGHAAQAAELWIQLDHLLEQRLLLPQQRLPSDTDGHNPPSPVR